MLIGESEIIATKLWKDKETKISKTGCSQHSGAMKALCFIKKLIADLLKNRYDRKKREMKQEFKDKWDLIESYFKEDKKFANEVRNFKC